MKKIVIGDIHACHDELMDLLDIISPASQDFIIALGDIFDRGPHNTKILKLFSGSSQFISIKGNHERKHYLISKGHCRPAISQTLTQQELGPLYPDLLTYVAALPCYLELDEAILVHGALEPGIPLEDQKEVVLTSSMSGARYLQEKYPLPWYELVDREKPVIFGHKGTAAPFVYQDKVFGIDTMCCRGGSLTALVLPEFKFYSVKSRKNYWSHARQNSKISGSPDVSRTDLDNLYNRIINLAEELKKTTGSRKAFAEEVRKRHLPSVLFKAYTGDLTRSYLLQNFHKIHF